MNPVLDGYRLEEPIDVARSSRHPPGSSRRQAGQEESGDPFHPPGRPADRRVPADHQASDAGPERARVWRGIRRSDGLPVAVKVYPSAQAGLARREAALLAAVEHPHVLTLLDIAEGPTHIGLVTDIAGGGSLRSLLARRGRLPWQEALTVLIPMADALAAADERGMVHGDLSTGNVLFDVAGRPLLADLGAARAATELSVPVAVTVSDVAPEVARGATPDHRSDLFSLGSVALQCLSGRPGWQADTLTDVLIQSIAGQWPDPEDVIAPDALLAIVRRLLDPDPRRRGSAAAAAIDLRQVGDPAPVDLAVEGPAGEIRLPATQVRPEVAALRRAQLAESARRRRRASRRWFEKRRSGAARHAAGRGPSVGDRLATLRRLALIALVVAVLGVGAVRAGLWWAGSGRVDPAAALPADRTHPAMASPASEPPSAPASASEASASAPTSGAFMSAPGSVSPPDSASDLVVDWTAVVTALDAARTRALAQRDPALLSFVYTAAAPARSDDARTIQRLVDAGYRLAEPAHVIGPVTVLPPADGSAPGTSAPASIGTVVRVIESMPAVQVLDGAGRVLGHTPAIPAAAVVLVLVPTGDGYRIDQVRRGD